ncbi:electron transport complex protein RnfC [Bibersteinia trehalosi USDA-ARS-USMARC-189]|uniref:Electron transport complex protein RnfC n=1 Tax=Bibersteinia trehalosi USDA-ARS-USMARC-189 TaxID=1263831 RepID=A0ABM5PE22_BIBTR|nr:electron transport complex protein RnfC [Bibersteinia trehalosi USDA-ARS-USMARC-189]
MSANADQVVENAENSASRVQLVAPNENAEDPRKAAVTAAIARAKARKQNQEK